MYPFLIVDALVLKVRKAGRVRAQSMLIAMGIDADGHREVLGLHLGDSESESSWGEFFGALKGRGLRGVDLVVSDDHKGLVKAISTHFQGASWQRCQTHLMRKLLDATPKSLQTEVRDHVRAVFNAPDEETARALTKHFVDAFVKRAPKATALRESAYEDATAVLALPVRYRRYLRTTNAAERLNEEIRRRERVIRIFPNGESAVRLVGALLMEMNEDSFLERRYFEMDEYWASKNAMPV